VSNFTVALHPARRPPHNTIIAFVLAVVYRAEMVGCGIPTGLARSLLQEAKSDDMRTETVETTSKRKSRPKNKNKKTDSCQNSPWLEEEALLDLRTEDTHV
jgi:hypothetical protein